MWCERRVASRAWQQRPSQPLLLPTGPRASHMARSTPPPPAPDPAGDHHPMHPHTPSPNRSVRKNACGPQAPACPIADEQQRSLACVCTTMQLHANVPIMAPSNHDPQSRSWARATTLAPNPRMPPHHACTRALTRSEPSVRHPCAPAAACCPTPQRAAIACLALPPVRAARSTRRGSRPWPRNRGGCGLERCVNEFSWVIDELTYRSTRA